MALDISVLSWPRLYACYDHKGLKTQQGSESALGMHAFPILYFSSQVSCALYASRCQQDSEHDSAQATFFLPCALLTWEYANTPASAIPVPAMQQESAQRRPLASVLLHQTTPEPVQHAHHS